ARAAALRLRAGRLRAGEDRGLRRGFRRGPLDGLRGDQRKRPCAGDQRGALRAVRVAPGRVVRGEGGSRAAQPVRRPRGEAGRQLMAVTEEQQQNPLLEGLRLRRTPDPCALVIFGASGDLTRRKLFPALYSLALRRLLPERFGVVGVARTQESDDQFRERMKEAVQEFGRDEFHQETWDWLAEGMRYVSTDFADESGEDHVVQALNELDEKRQTAGNRVYYFAI